ncbi:MAG: hypothetical protein IT384_21495 [Deltaproteobacteria bacterium]|nr:hypothetical protein [Deltaproteobacteria bacterium]
MNDEDGEGEPNPLDAEPWRSVRDVCGSCIAWRCEEPRAGDEIATGACKLRPEMGRVPADLPKCNRYMPRGQFTFTPERIPRSPKRRAAKTIAVVRYGAAGEKVTAAGEKNAAAGEKNAAAGEKNAAAARSKPSSAAMTPPEAPGPRGGAIAPPRLRGPIVRAPAPRELDLGELKSPEVVRWALTELIRQELGKDRRSLHSRFKSGKVTAELDGVPPREMTAERFFAMVDRLKSSFELLDRALLRKKDALGDDCADLRAQLGRMQGSFTTFNFLFEDREDYFSSKE